MRELAGAHFQALPLLLLGTKMIPLVLVVMMFLPAVSGITRERHPLYWNASNPLFSRNDSKLAVDIDDNVDFMCPNYYNNPDESQWEYYSIFIVSKKEYDECEIFNPKENVTHLLNCTHPNSNKSVRFTLLIASFQPVPSMPDFQKGKYYYLISTSGGTAGTINNQVGGACKTRRMRLILDLTGNSTTIAPPSSNSTNLPTSVSTKATTGPTVSSSTTTKKTTTTTTPTTTTTTTTSTPKPTTNFPDGNPVDPNTIVIDATNADKNTAIINKAGQTVHPVHSLVILTLLILCRIMWL